MLPGAVVLMCANKASSCSLSIASSAPWCVVTCLHCEQELSVQPPNACMRGRMGQGLCRMHAADQAQTADRQTAAAMRVGGADPAAAGAGAPRGLYVRYLQAGAQDGPSLGRHGRWGPSPSSRSVGAGPQQQSCLPQGPAAPVWQGSLRACCAPDCGRALCLSGGRATAAADTMLGRFALSPSLAANYASTKVPPMLPWRIPA